MRMVLASKKKKVREKKGKQESRATNDCVITDQFVRMAASCPNKSLTPAASRL
jgi:hypothetical protein